MLRISLPQPQASGREGREGNPWFVAADVCRGLGLGVEKGASRHLESLDNAEKNLRKIEGMRGRTPLLISESGLYKLIMRARQSNPEARDWQVAGGHQDLPEAVRRESPPPTTALDEEA